MINSFKEYVNNSFTAYHAVANAEMILKENGFVRLYEKDEWKISLGGKYYVIRNGSALIAFTVGTTDYLKIAASHVDSPALKIKENPIIKENGYYKLNVEKYGGGILYTFFDRPLKVAGRVVCEENGKIVTENVVSDYTLIIPSQAIHINRNVNDGFTVNAQTDLCPVFDVVSDEEAPDFYKTLTDKNVIDADLYLVNSDEIRVTGAFKTLISSPRTDNLTSVFTSLSALISQKKESGICVAALYNSEEIGNSTTTGSDGDFFDTFATKLRFASGKTEDELSTMLSRSVLLSVDVAHALHPAHPEKSDPTNRPKLGGGIVIKYNAGGSYVTDGRSAALLKTIFKKADVSYQTYHSRSDIPCGSTLGRSFVCRNGMLACDVGLPQLAMHSAYETFAKDDLYSLSKGISAFYDTYITVSDDTITLN